MAGGRQWKKIAQKLEQELSDLKKGGKTLGEGVKPTPGGGGGGSTTTGAASTSDVEKYLRAAENGDHVNNKFGQRFGEHVSLLRGNLDAAAAAEGRGVWGMAGQHAIRGAIGGAAIGGTTESLQGGSFWDGAKAGAFKGAVGWTGLRMGMKATGATSANPFAGKGAGMLSAGHNMWAVTGGKNANISGQAAAILRQREGDGLARGVMYMNSKK